MRHRVLEGTPTNLCRSHVDALGHIRIVSGVLQHPYHSKFEQHCFPASGGSYECESRNIRTVWMNQLTGDNLKDGINNESKDGSPISYQILCSVYQLEGELKPEG